MERYGLVKADFAKGQDKFVRRGLPENSLPLRNASRGSAAFGVSSYSSIWSAAKRLHDLGCPKGFLVSGRAGVGFLSFLRKKGLSAEKRLSGLGL